MAGCPVSTVGTLVPAGRIKGRYKIDVEIQARSNRATYLLRTQDGVGYKMVTQASRRQSIWYRYYLSPFIDEAGGGRSVDNTQHHDWNDTVPGLLAIAYGGYQVPCRQ